MSLTPRKKFTSGFVSRLELENFKSWKGRHNIGPFNKGFTAVIGSNGAGKSNLMDAISFVTGVKAKRLRGEQLRDLIFNGDQNAEAENRHMKVTMVYSCGRNEMEGKREGEEIVFSRSVTYSTSGSVFEIGNRRVTFDEFENTFSKLNILVSARNFLIFQGDVEATASKSPTELSMFFEQVSGSDQFREEYERCLELKEKLEAEALEKIHQAKMAKAERKEAREQKEETDRYNELLQERDMLKVELVLFQILTADSSLQKEQQELHMAKDKVTEADNVEAMMENQLKEAIADQSRKLRDTSIAEQEAKKAQKQAASSQTAYEKKSQLTAREKSNKKNAEAALAAAKATLEKQEAEVAELESMIAAFTKKESEILAAIQEEKGQSEEEEEELSAEQKAELERLRLEADKDNAALRSEETRIDRALGVCKDRLDVAKSNKNQLDTRMNEIVEEKKVLLKKKQKGEQSLATLKQKVADCERAKQERDVQITQLGEELKQKQALYSQAREMLSMSKAHSAENRRTKRLEEAVEALSRHHQGVRGRLVKLVRPTQKKYALAVDTALGKHMDSIVIDTEAAAFECMKYLREQRLGTATFLPLDTIKPKPISEDKRRLGGAYRLTIELLEYPEAIERAVKFAAGDSIICDTLEDARVLCFQRNVRVKAVSLEGHLISPRGEMTGGAMGEAGRMDRFTENAISRAREDREQLEKDIGELERKLDSLRAKALQPDSEGSQAQQRLKITKTDLEDTEIKLKECESRLNANKNALEQATEKLDELESEHTSLYNTLNEVREKIAQKETQVFKGLHKGDIETRREVEARTKRHVELNDTRGNLSRLESHLRYLRSADRTKAVEECEKSVQQKEQSLLEAEEALQNAKTYWDEAQRNAEKAEELKKSVDMELDIARARVTECQKALANASKEKGNYLKKVAHSESQLSTLKAKKQEIIKQAELDGLTLPYNDNQVDVSSYQALYSSEDDYNKKLAELALEIESLAPNTRADTRFQEASERSKDTDANLAEAREAALEAAQEFEKVKVKRIDMFMEMFEHVAQKIAPIYRQLTKRANAPSGGNAFLALVDQENPFSGGIKFECMPPNKRYRAMEQLSGGEKTVAALALLFAIHSYRPSPFFVLDEVDAALDNDNVERVSNYIRLRSSLEDEDTHESEDDEDENEEDVHRRRFQCLVISLKDTFYCKAEALVGVYRDVEQDSSKSLTLDLSQYAS